MSRSPPPGRIFVRRASPNLSRSSVSSVDDDRAHALGPREDVAQVGDDLGELGVLVQDALALEGSQPPQLHVEDRARLDLRQLEALLQLTERRIGRWGVADERDDRVEVVEGDDEALEDVGALLRLAQPVARAPLDDLHLVGDVVDDRVLERQRAGHVVDQGQVDDAEGVLQLGHLVELVEDHLGVGIALELDDQAHALAVRLVAHVADAGDLLVVDELGDLHREVRLVDLVRQLGRDDALSALLVLLDLADGPHADRAAAGLVRRADPVGAHDEPTGWEVRAGDDLVQLGEGDVGVRDRRDDRVGDLVQVVGRHVGGHADGDAGRAVDEQVREPARQDDGLGLLPVVVLDEVDGLLIDVAQQLHRQGDRRASV
jgi:hypothetical protein